MTNKIPSHLLRQSLMLATVAFLSVAMPLGVARSLSTGYLAGNGKGEYRRTTPLGGIPPYALQEVHRGMTFGFLARNGYFSSDEAMEQIDRMSALGVKWVSLVVVPMQENPFSTRIYSDYEYTASDGELELVIRRLHAKGIRVMLYTCLEMHDSNWRGLVNFPNPPGEQIQGVCTDYWSQWFKSFTTMMVNYGRLAQREGVELLSLGPEMSGAVKEDDHWSQLVDEVRKVYKGPLVYEVEGKVDFDHLPAWYKKLDIIGYSFYRPAAPNSNATVKEMVKFLQPAVAEMRKLSEMTGKPLIFTECGTGSYKGASVHPGDFRTPGKVFDGEEQARYVEAVFSAFWNEPWWRGLYWWKWDEHQYRPAFHTDPAGDESNTVAGKPAAEALKKWFSQTNRP